MLYFVCFTGLLKEIGLTGFATKKYKYCHNLYLVENFLYEIHILNIFLIPETGHLSVIYYK
jgi:hypothetical protein